MDLAGVLAQTPTDPGGGWGAILMVIAGLSTVAAYVAGSLLQRRRGKSDFTGEVIKEMELWKNRTLERDKVIVARDQEILTLTDQYRKLSQENAVLVRREHDETLERLEALITRAEVSRVGATGTDAKLDHIQELVNDRLTRALDKIDRLELRLKNKFEETGEA